MSGEEKFVLCGPEPYVPIPEDSLGQILYEGLISQTNRDDAMVDAFTETSTSYNKILQKSCELAQALRKYGCTNETVISIFSENNVDYFIPVVASLFAGTITAPINHFYQSHELNHIINLTQPTLLFVSIRAVSKFMQVMGDYPFLKRIIIFDSNRHVPGTQNLNEFIAEQLRGQTVLPYSFRPWTGDINEQVAFIMSSSGTTGLSKGVMLTHKNMNTRIAHERDPRYGDTELIKHVSTGILPFYHAYGLSLGITALAKGNLLVIFDHFDEKVFLEAIPKYKITILNIVPSIAIFLTKTNDLEKYDVSTVIKVLCGGAVLNGSTERTLKQRLRINYLASAYGQTELTLACTQVKKGDAKSGTCGQVLPCMCLKIVDPLTDRAVGPNERGEVRVKGPVSMKGYYRNKKATEETFTSDGWLKTGDLGYVDREGYLYIVDRLKELIKYNAFQIPPAELESLLITHPKVLEAAVVGRPDEKSGELPTAFVVRRTSEVTEKELQDFIAEKVSPQKKLRGGVIFIPELPKNATGKVLRRVLRDKLLEEYKKCKL